MTRIMRDSVDVMKIPIGGTDIAAGYEDGTFRNSDALKARFPHVPRVLIDVNGSMPQAHVRDWETGDKGGNLEQWVADHNKSSGRGDAVVYCNRSTIAEVRRLTGSQALGRDYWLWVATLDGTVFTELLNTVDGHQVNGVIACQDKGARQTGANFDESVVFADWWLVTSPPAPVSQHPAVPPGQWNNPSQWTWQSVTVTGTGMNGRLYSFVYDAANNTWNRVAHL